MKIAYALLFMTVCGAQVGNANNELIKRNDGPAKLQERIVKLQQAASEQNIFPVIEAVSREFAIERDYGGMFIDGANAVTNFLQAFQLDNSKLFKEYQGIGWQQLKEILAGDKLLKITSDEYCTFGVRFHNDMVKDEKLCFRKGLFDHWFIVRKINGGD